VTALLLFIALEIPICTGIILLVVHKTLLVHQEVLAKVIARRASDLTYALAQAEGRVTEAARYGVRAGSGPARLRD
jgi:hypothetical protein